MSATAQQHSSLRHSPHLQKDHRRHRRAKISLEGRFLSETNEEHSLVITDISCGGASMLSQSIPDIGTTIVCYLDQIGRIVGKVIRHTEGGFAISFQTSQLKRDRIADKLTWLVNKDRLGLSEERGAERFSADSPAVVIRQDGRRLQCRVVDISLTGAGFETDGPRPMIGETIIAGALPAEVVRSNKDGFGVRFIIQNKDKQG